MLRFRKVTSENLRIGKLPVALATSNLECILTQIQLDLKQKSFFEGFITKI